jgi:hypothetical protein
MSGQPSPERLNEVRRFFFRGPRDKAFTTRDVAAAMEISYSSASASCLQLWRNGRIFRTKVSGIWWYSQLKPAQPHRRGE